MLRGWLCVLLVSFPALVHALGSVPGPGKLLPADTLFVVTAPDFERLEALWGGSPQARLWNDPAMKSFHDKFGARWRQEFLQPLERESKAQVDACSKLVKGQLTFGITRNNWDGEEEQQLGFLLLLDSKDKRHQLKKQLSDLRKAWTEAGKAPRLEKIRGLEFAILPLGSNALPSLLRQFFPQVVPSRRAAAEGSPSKMPGANEVVFGQAESLLVVANSVAAVEKVLARLGGDTLPCLGDAAGFQTGCQAVCRDAPLYAWFDSKTYFDVITRRAARRKPVGAPDTLEEIRPEKFIAASGLGAVNSVAFGLSEIEGGWLAQVFLSAPETSRQGLTQVLAGESKDWNPPPFVPGDIAKFARWRLDGQKTCEALRKMLAEITPQSLNGLNAILNTAHDAAKLKEPEFDLRKTLLPSLGDDFIQYERAPRGGSPAELDTPASLFLAGSPNPEQLAACLKWLMVVLSDTPAEREFLGRKVYSAPVPPLPLLVSELARTGPQRTLHFSATSNYLALSTDVAMLEEYLRNPESQTNKLRETPGLTEAAQKVAGPGTRLFGFTSQSQSSRARCEALRANPSATNSLAILGSWPAVFGMASPEEACEEWMDFSLFPPFDDIARYFHFTVYGAGANADGLSFKYFAPQPPALRGPAARN